jgi:hydroxypyruvate reductase
MNHTAAKALDIYQVALAAAVPGPMLTRALAHEPVSDRVWIVALGKAAAAMAEAAVRVLESRGHAPAGGLVVSAERNAPPHQTVSVVVGDHPEPGAGSLEAAAALDRLVARIPAGDTVWVLLSGGTTSLIGAPQAGISPRDLAALYAQLLRSGLDIKAMNMVRKRFTRWSGGRLARSLSHAAAVGCFIVSDVIGDDLAAIGSGPCVADPARASDVRALLVQAGLWDGVPTALRDHIGAIERGELPETPKPGDPEVERVPHLVIASNRLAVLAAAARARELGLTTEIAASPLSGEAAAAGERIARQLTADGTPPTGHSTAARCLILGGETTVTMGVGAGLGGRCQELALAAARTLDGSGTDVVLLAAGTDGRDGPTDAAGAIVDGTTWKRIVAAGRHPQRDLDDHNSHAALAAADALIRTGPTNTNVMDVVIGIA